MIDFFNPTGDKGAPPGVERRIMGNRRRDFLAVVGELDHQEALRCLLDQHGRSVLASLVPEPANPHDLHAVAVVIDERKVGYLTSDVAKKYGPILSARTTPIMCPAELHGGEWDTPTIRVVLDFSLVYAAARGT